MPRHWRKALHLVETIRLDLLLGVISNLWLMLLLAFYVEPPNHENPALGRLGLPLAMVLTAVIALGLTTAAVSLNDLLDVRHDRNFFPSRPLPAGHIRKRWALLASFLAALAAIVATWPLGGESLTLTCIALVATGFYNFVGRFVPAAGVITLAVMYAIAMAIPNPRLGFAWPIAITLTHVFACATMRRAMPGSRPRLKPKDLIAIVLAWAFICLMLASYMNRRGTAVITPTESIRWIWTGPLAAFLVFIPLAVRLIRSPKAANRAGALRFAHTANLWLLVYPPLWLFAGQQYAQGGVLSAILLLAIAWRPLIHRLRQHARADPHPGYRLDLNRPLRNRRRNPRSETQP